MYRVLLIMSLATLLLAGPAHANGGAEGDLEVGVFVGLGFPDGYGDGLLRLAPDDGPLYGVRFGFFFTPRWSVELSGQQLASETSLAPGAGVPDVDFDINSVRLNGLYNFRPGRKLRPFVTFGVGLEQSKARPLLNEDDAGINLGGGVRFFFTESLGLRFDARYVAADVGGAVDARQDNFEAAIGVLLSFGGVPSGDADSDGDGVPDRRDRCPGTPAGAVVDAAGCPLDVDGDGVPDGIDACPNTPAEIPVDRLGCPRDTDGDGVHDGADRCPGTPTGARVDSRGCPRDGDGDGVPDGIDRCPDTPRATAVDATGCALDRDADGDGVNDERDRCPRTPAGAFVDTYGCPVDSDGDGVFDGLDRCPGTPRGMEVDSRGCKALFEDTRGSLVLEGVTFALNSATLTPQAERILDRVALSLQEWSEIRVEVAGHTDALGDADYNLRLSGRRAEAVLLYLQARGVAEDRMVARGYGEAWPLVGNDTQDGRRQNRRVELKRLD